MDYQSNGHDKEPANTYIATQAQRSVLSSVAALPHAVLELPAAAIKDPPALFEEHGTPSPDLIQLEPGYTDPSIWTEGLPVPPTMATAQYAVSSQRSPGLFVDAVSLFPGNPADPTANSPPQSPQSTVFHPTGPHIATKRPHRPRSGVPYRRSSFPTISSRRFSGAGMANAELYTGGYTYRDYPPKRAPSLSGDLDDNDSSDWPGRTGLTVERPGSSTFSRASSEMPAVIAPESAPVATETSQLPLSGGRIAPLTDERLVEPVVLTDSDGVTWMDFEYKLKSKRWRYRVRISDLINDVPSDALDFEFQKANCIYPHAMVPKTEYYGHRQKYEMTCNDLGWRIAYLNPSVQGQRGLIQRAVDSYRNSSSDVSLRSRRARKLLMGGTSSKLR